MRNPTSAVQTSLNEQMPHVPDTDTDVTYKDSSFRNK